MADLLQAGAAFLAAQLKASAAHAVTLKRGTKTTAGVMATVGGGKPLSVDDGEGGTRIVRADRDFLISAADYQFDGVAKEPARGDQVVDTDGTFELMSPGGDEPPWRWADQFRIMLRLHTKQVS